jgi:hypothetical protein
MRLGGYRRPERKASYSRSLSLPHAKTRKHPIQNFFDIHRTEQLVERGRSFAHVMRRKYGVALRAELRNHLLQCVPGSYQRGQVPFATERRLEICQAYSLSEHSLGRSSAKLAQSVSGDR